MYEYQVIKDDEVIKTFRTTDYLSIDEMNAQAGEYDSIKIVFVETTK